MPNLDMIELQKNCCVYLAVPNNMAERVCKGTSGLLRLQNCDLYGTCAPGEQLETKLPCDAAERDDVYSQYVLGLPYVMIC